MLMPCKVRPGSLLEKLVPLREITLPPGGSPDVARGIGVLNSTQANRAGEARVKKNELVKAAVAWIRDGMAVPAPSAGSPARADPAIQEQLRLVGVGMLSFEEQLDAHTKELDAQKQAAAELEAEVEMQGADIAAIRKLIERATAPASPSADPRQPKGNLLPDATWGPGGKPSK